MFASQAIQSGIVNLLKPEKLQNKYKKCISLILYIVLFKNIFTYW